MDTFVALSEARRRRRIHSAEFKAHIVAACCKPGVPSASVAMAITPIRAHVVIRTSAFSKGAQLEFCNLTACIYNFCVPNSRPYEPQTQ